MLPRRREQGLLIEHVADETIVYDTKRHDAHCLNRVSALVWEHCDGRTSRAAMVELLRAELGLDADEATIGLILEQLAEANLVVEERPARSAAAALRSRRQVARQLAAIGLTGVVMSIAVPPAAAAASKCSCPNGTAVCSPGQICCCNNSGNPTTCICVTASNCTGQSQTHQLSCT